MHNLHLRNLLSAVALSALLPLGLTACDDGGSGSGSGDDSTGGSDTNETNDAATATVTVTDTTPTTVTDTTPTTGDTDPTTGADTTDTTGDTEETTGDTEETTGDTEETTGDTEGPTTGDTEEPTTGGMLECSEASFGAGAPLSIDGDNTGSGDDVVLSCSGDGGGEEIVYSWTSGEAGYYQFTTNGSELDSAIAVLDACDGTELACNDDISSFGGNFASIITVELEADTEYPVVVDSYGGEVGAFTLQVRQIENPLALPDAYCSDTIELATCDVAGMNTMSYSSTSACAFGQLTAATYDVAVEAGDCIYASADNIDAIAGATGMTSHDLALAIVDPSGDIAFFDDELDCTDPAYGDYACPEGGAVASMDGTMQILVFAYGGEDCPDGAPYTLNVAVNGTDIDLSGGPTAQDQGGLCI